MDSAYKPYLLEKLLPLIVTSRYIIEFMVFAGRYSIVYFHTEKIIYFIKFDNYDRFLGKFLVIST